MSTPTPRTDAAYAEWQSSWTRTPFGPDFARTLERELAAERAKTADCGLTIASLCDGILGEDFADRSDQMLIRVGCRMKAELATERQKVSALTEILESICEEWGRNHDANPIGAGQKMETLASKALENPEDKQPLTQLNQ